VNQNLLIFFLRNFWRLVLALAGFFLGLLWAIFGLKKTVAILCVMVLGFYFGKWVDEGRPNAGLMPFLRKFLD
jgi:uncharacterized membrane protein